MKLFYTFIKYDKNWLKYVSHEIENYLTTCVNTGFSPSATVT